MSIWNDGGDSGGCGGILGLGGGEGSGGLRGGRGLDGGREGGGGSGNGDLGVGGGCGGWGCWGGAGAEGGSTSTTWNCSLLPPLRRRECDVPRYRLPLMFACMHPLATWVLLGCPLSSKHRGGCVGHGSSAASACKHIETSVRPRGTTETSPARWAAPTK